MSAKAKIISEEILPGVHLSCEVPWEIPNFRSVQRTAGQINQQSLTFETHDSGSRVTKWLVSLKGGENSNIQVYVKLLKKDGSFSKLMAHWTLHYATRTQPDKFNKWQESGFGLYTENHEVLLWERLGGGWCFGQPDSVWNTFCINDEPLRLKFHLDIQASQQPIVKAEDRFSENSILKLTDNFERLYLYKESTDLRIICSDNSELQAHHLVLRAQNPVFESMLKADMSEKNTGVVKVDDICGVTMEILLRYFYTGKLLPNWSDPKIIHEFVYAAGKYQLSEVLEYLDNVLGTDEVPTCDVQLLALVNKLELSKADARIAEKLGKLFSQVKEGKELLKLLGH